jgi:hypothetical protein
MHTGFSRNRYNIPIMLIPDVHSAKPISMLFSPASPPSYLHGIPCSTHGNTFIPWQGAEHCQDPPERALSVSLRFFEISLVKSFIISGNDSTYGCVGQIGLSGKVSFGRFTQAADHLKHTPFL